METTFYKCKKCGKVIHMIGKYPCPTMCCGEAMEELVPNTVDASGEKHVPVYEIDRENKIVNIKIGAVEHPMTDEHYIQWIALQTKWNFYFRFLDPGKPAKGTMDLCSKDEVVAVYAYCNLHGLWKA